MTTKQLRKMAKEMASLEIKIRNAVDQNERTKYEQQMFQLTDSHNLSLDEMVQLDEMIQNILTN
jgi:predicted  nucleic acid-binding Zn-ribbon protein